MTYCTVEQVGTVKLSKSQTDSTIDHVLRAAELLDIYFGFNGLYEPESTWDHSPIDIGFEADGQIIVPLRYPCISLTQIDQYSSGYTLLQVVGLTLTDHYANTYLARVDSGFAAGRWLSGSEGVRGHARFKDLAVDDEVKAGQSILRADEIVIFEEDGVAIADDELLVPPRFLTGVAVTVARRMVKLERDQDAKWDDGGNTLLDGFLPMIEWYKLMAVEIYRIDDADIVSAVMTLGFDPDIYGADEVRFEVYNVLVDDIRGGETSWPVATGFLATELLYRRRPRCRTPPTTLSLSSCGMARSARM